MASIPKTQSAWLAVRRGTPSSALEFKTDIPVPTVLAPGEVLVKVQAAALNPIGYKLLRMLPNFAAKRPIVPEHDLAGIVVNANGTTFSNGDAVFGWIPMDLNMKTRQGALAQYTRLPAENLVLRPQNVSPVQIAGVPLVALTAYQALYNVGNLQPGQTIFVNGGSSAVGVYAIQLAKAAGCTVVASASGKNEEFVKALGADEFVDYTKSALHIRLASPPPSPKYHLLLDAVGLTDPSLYSHSEAYLAPGGIFISTGPMPSLSFKGISEMMRLAGNLCLPRWLGGVKRDWKLVQVKHNKEDLEKIKELIAADKVRPVVDSVFSLEDAQKAYDKILTNRARGKVIIKIDEAVN